MGSVKFTFTMANQHILKIIKRWFLAYLKSKGLSMEQASFEDICAYNLIGEFLKKPASNAIPIGDVESSDENGGEYLYIQKACAE